MPYLDLILHELVHLILTLLAFGVTWTIIKPKDKKKRYLFLLTLMGAFLGEFFLDSDHLIDYILVFGFNLNLKDFFDGKMFDISQKTYVLFHSWEWILVLVFFIKFTKNIYLKYFLVALTLGISLHLIYDTFYNHYDFLGYSLIYRSIYNFNPKYFTY